MYVLPGRRIFVGAHGEAGAEVDKSDEVAEDEVAEVVDDEGGEVEVDEEEEEEVEAGEDEEDEVDMKLMKEMDGWMDVDGSEVGDEEEGLIIDKRRLKLLHQVCRETSDMMKQKFRRGNFQHSHFQKGKLCGQQTCRRGNYVVSKLPNLEICES